MSYTIKSGDTLSEIAAANNTTVDAIAKANGISDPNKISAGATLDIPGGNSVSDTVSNVVDNVKDGVTDFVNTVKNVPAGIKSDFQMGIDKVRLSEDEFVKKYGQDKVNDFNSRTNVTKALNAGKNLTDAELKSIYGLNDDEIDDYKNDVRFKEYTENDDDNGSGSNGSGADGTGADGEGEEDAESLISEANILKMLETSGFIQNQEDLKALLADPAQFLTDRGANLSALAAEMKIDPDALGTMLDPTDPKYALKNLEFADVSTVDGKVTINIPTEQDLEGYKVESALNDLNSGEFDATAAQGEMDDEFLVDTDEVLLDKQGVATGVNKDGTVNYTGLALNDYAQQKFGSVVDTSTVDGKLLAEALGEGNYVDSKATILGQMELISEQFVDSQGNPRIPSWAQGVFGSITTNMAFSGLTGTQKIARISKGLMESSLSIAKDEATFFQTLTTKNLDNRQEMIVKKAATLAAMDEAELGVKERSAIHNSKAFLDLNLTNLNNEQEAEIFNTKAKIDALFTETSEENLRRRLSFETEADFQKFYAGIDLEAQSFMAELNTSISKFNSGEINDFSEFRSTLESRREEFVTNLQWLIDESNAGWRRDVETENTGLVFDAAAADVKAITDLTGEALNRTWNDVDTVLDYLFKGAYSEEEFDLRLLLGELSAQAGSSGGSSLLGTLISAGAQIGAAMINQGSDARMKENIQPYDVHKGIQFYTWDWNAKAKAIGWDKYPTFGVIAQEVQKTHPEAVVEGEHGYLMVNYGKLINEV